MPKPKKKPHHLTNLRVSRVDVVDRGANLDGESGEGSHIVFFKRDEDGRAVDDAGKLVTRAEVFATITKAAEAKYPSDTHAEAIRKYTAENPDQYDSYRRAPNRTAEAPKETPKPTKLELAASSPTLQRIVARVHRFSKAAGESLADFATERLLEMAQKRADLEKLSPESALVALISEAYEPTPWTDENRAVMFLIETIADEKNAVLSAEVAFTLDSIRTAFQEHQIQVLAA